MEQAKIDEFDKDLKELCKKHGVELEVGHQLIVKEKNDTKDV